MGAQAGALLRQQITRAGEGFVLLIQLVELALKLSDELLPALSVGALVGTILLAAALLSGDGESAGAIRRFDRRRTARVAWVLTFWADSLQSLYRFARFIFWAGLTSSMLDVGLE